MNTCVFSPSCDLVEQHGAAYNEPIAPEACVEMFSKSYGLEWFKMQTRTWVLIDMQVYTDQWRLILMEWDDGDFESLLPHMPSNIMAAMYTGIKMQDVAGERQKELTGLSITSSAGGKRGDLTDEVEQLKQSLREEQGRHDTRNARSGAVHPSAD
jgi:hypothetical protein